VPQKFSIFQGLANVSECRKATGFNPWIVLVRELENVV